MPIISTSWIYRLPPPSFFFPIASTQLLQLERFPPSSPIFSPPLSNSLPPSSLRRETHLLARPYLRIHRQSSSSPLFITKRSRRREGRPLFVSSSPLLLYPPLDSPSPSRAPMPPNGVESSSGDRCTFYLRFTKRAGSLSPSLVHVASSASTSPPSILPQPSTSPLSFKLLLASDSSRLSSHLSTLKSTRMQPESRRPVVYSTVQLRFSVRSERLFSFIIKDRHV